MLRQERSISAFVPREPELKLGDMPVWCHHHCGKMQLSPEETGENQLVIRGSAAEVKVSIHQYGWDSQWRRWNVDYRITESANEWYSGRIIMGDSELRVAFGLDNQVDDSGKWLLEKYGGTTAQQGLFIRYRDYLNVPGPGTGHDGDPNVSIKLGFDIKQAVGKLLK